MEHGIHLDLGITGIYATIVYAAVLFFASVVYWVAASRIFTGIAFRAIQKTSSAAKNVSLAVIPYIVLMMFGELFLVKLFSSLLAENTIALVASVGCAVGLIKESNAHHALIDAIKTQLLLDEVVKPEQQEG